MVHTKTFLIKTHEKVKVDINHLKVVLETAENINMTAGKVAGSNFSNDVLDNLTSKYGEMENKFPVEGVTCKRDINGNTGSYY